MRRNLRVFVPCLARRTVRSEKETNRSHNFGRLGIRFEIGTLMCKVVHFIFSSKEHGEAAFTPQVASTHDPCLCLLLFKRVGQVRDGEVHLAQASEQEGRRDVGPN